MTTPGQALPSSTLEKVLGLGAFQIGDGGSTSYGQNLTEEGIGSLVGKMPFATLDNMLDMLFDVLTKLPLEALEAFKALIPDWLEGGLETVASAAGKIISALDPRKIPMYIEEFAEWTVDVFEAAIQNLKNLWQLLIDTLHNALTGAATVLNTLEDLVGALLSIPFGNVIGVGGPANIGQSILGFVNHLVGGLVGVLGGTASLADVFNIGKEVSANASQGAYAWQVLGIRDNTSTSSGFLPSGRANFDLTASAFKATAPTISVTAAASAICYDRVTVSQPLGVVSWVGYGNTNITAFYINVWQAKADGSWDLIHHSPNIVSELVGGTTAADARYMFYDLDTPVAQVATEHYLYEYVVVGTGTHHMIGETTGSWLPAHPSAPVSQYGFTRNNTAAPNSPPSSIAKVDLVGANTVPWTEAAINRGDASTDAYDPLTVYFTESGSVPIPKWAGYIEVIPLGMGGNGANGGLVYGWFGLGGSPGKFNPGVWVRGVDFDDTVTVINFVRGDATNDGTSTFSITGKTRSAAPGADATTNKLGANVVGTGPGVFHFNDEPYAGGGNQSAVGAAGVRPGGGGSGGNWITSHDGGPGAPGAGWVRFIQGDQPGGGPAPDGPDTTPPPAPALVIDDVTPSSITVHATGGVDA